MDEHLMISWHDPHPVYGRGDTCQACGCGWGSEVHEEYRARYEYDGAPTPKPSRTWYCTACVYEERLRPAVVAFTRPAKVDYSGAATFYCEEHLESAAPPLPFPPESFLINIALHAGRNGDDPNLTMLPELLEALA